MNHHDSPASVSGHW